MCLYRRCEYQRLHVHIHSTCSCISKQWSRCAGGCCHWLLTGTSLDILGRGRAEDVHEPVDHHSLGRGRVLVASDVNGIPHFSAFGDPARRCATSSVQMLSWWRPRRRSSQARSLQAMLILKWPIPVRLIKYPLLKVGGAAALIPRARRCKTNPLESFAVSQDQSSSHIARALRNLLVDASSSRHITFRLSFLFQH